MQIVISQFLSTKMIEALFCLVNRGHVVFDICRIHICNYLFQSPIFFLVINLRENTYLHSTTYVNIMVQFFDKNHINPLGIYLIYMDKLEQRMNI